MLDVGQQREPEFELFVKLQQLRRFVWADTNDHRFPNIRRNVTKAARLLRATGCIGLGVEIDQHFSLLVLLERKILLELINKLD